MTEGNGLLRTALYDLHVAQGAKMVEFGGWCMPVQYTGIIGEHRRVRESAGMFDLSHMGRLHLRGAGAGQFINFIGTNDALALAPGQVQYSLVCNEQGGVLDDILVYRLDEEEYLLVVNASNRRKILKWLGQRLEDRLMDWTMAAVELEDRTMQTVMIGVQGPRAQEVLQPLVDLSLDALKYYHCAEAGVLDSRGLISRTGYTGEDGFEIILPNTQGRELWERLSDEPNSLLVGPAGLGARDTLRLEAGMPLYGHELGETINPLEVGLGRFVRLDKEAFVGRDVLEAISLEGPSRRLIGLEVTDRAIARQGSTVLAGGEVAGTVTSGSYSPTLDRSICMALVSAGAAEGESSLTVEVRNSPHPALKARLPFFHRRKKK